MLSRMRPMATLCLSLATLSACVLPTVAPDAGPMGPSHIRPVVALAWETIGKSVEGRPIRYLAIGKGYRQVLWIGGIHGNEVEGMLATRELPAAFHATPGLESRVTLHIVEDMNPDGRAARRRTNSQGVDLNRDFPATNRTSGRGLSQPESRAIHELIVRLEPDLVIVAHSWGRAESFVNFDGPARSLAHLFSRHSGFPVKLSANLPATPGSMGSWCGWDRRVPILTLEWRRGTPTEHAWERTREAILAVIRGE